MNFPPNLFFASFTKNQITKGLDVSRATSQRLEMIRPHQGKSLPSLVCEQNRRNRRGRMGHFGKSKSKTFPFKIPWKLFSFDDFGLEFVAFRWLKSSRKKRDLNDITAAWLLVSFSQLPAAKNVPKQGNCDVIKVPLIS